MAFTTMTFLFIFLPISVGLYYLVPRTWKNFVLFVLSIAFYSWGGLPVIKFILAITLFAYVSGCILETTKQWAQTKRKMMLACSIVGTIFPLLYFKYYDYAASSMNRFFATNLPMKALVLPLGISFFTFKAVSYVMDIFRGDVESSQVRKISNAFLYILFFPQVVSGPIEQYKNFVPQIQNRKLALDAVSHGLWRISVGFAKKVVIADILGERVDLIWRNFELMGVDTPTAWLGVILYMMQIYFDFSGYSDIAIGLCEIFGFKFGENFNYPYISKSITEFWRRWHISLSTWFREYLYIPLGGNRRGNVYLNLLIVFFVTGIWHGVANTFLVWGMFHGFFIIIERLLKEKTWYQKIPGYLKIVVTNIIVMFGWIFFRAPSGRSSIQYLRSLFVSNTNDLQFTFPYYVDKRIWMLLGIAVIACIPFWKNYVLKVETTKAFAILRMFAMVILLGIAIITMTNSNYNPNIYFQF